MIVGCEHRVGRERRVEYFFTNPYSAILPFCLEKKNDFGRIRRISIIGWHVFWMVQNAYVSG